MTPKEMKVANTKNGKKLSASDVDRYAILSEKVKQITETTKDLNDRFKQFLKPGQQAVGYTFMVELSAEPEVSQKVDYREELIKAIGETKVLDLEDAAEAMPKGKGTPRLMVKPNPDNRPEYATIAKKIVAQVRRDLVA